MKNKKVDFEKLEDEYFKSYSERYCKNNKEKELRTLVENFIKDFEKLVG